MKYSGVFLTILFSISWIVSVNAQINSPTLILPVDETQNYDIEPAYFEWTEVDTAEFYEIQVSSGAEFDSIIFYQSLSDISTTTSSLFYNWQFHWRVRAGWDSSGFNVYGDWSNSNRFAPSYQAPTNYSPEDNSLGEDYSQVNFSWELDLDPIVENGNNYYTFQLSWNSNFTAIVDDQEIQSSKTAQVSDLESDTTYFWRVRYHNDFGQSDWSNTTRFKTISTLLEKVILVKPENRLQNVSPLNILFEWESVNDAEGYNFELAEDSLFAQIVESSSIQSTSYTTNVTQYNAVLFWRVQAENSEGLGEWSDVWRFFTTLATPQDPPVLLNPENDSHSLPIDSIAFKWHPVNGAEMHHIQLSSDASFSEIFFSKDSLDSSLYVYGFQENTDYFWRVKGSNELGEGPWSGPWHFRTQTGTNIIENLDIISTFNLQQNYPNPFNPTTMINYQLPITSHVELSIYNASGQRVATLVSGNQSIGTHQVEWNASEFASGVYYYQLRTNAGYIQTKKMILLK